MNRPLPPSYSPWAAQYIDLVPHTDVLSILTQQIENLKVLFENNRSKALYAYAAEKWTLQEVLGHINDAERIMGFRLLSFARAEIQELPGFDQDDYVLKANFNQCALEHLIEEFRHLRQSNILLIKNLSPEALDRSGKASGLSITARALVYVLAGHVIHHINVLKEKYDLV